MPIRVQHMMDAYEHMSQTEHLPALKYITLQLMALM